MVNPTPDRAAVAASIDRILAQVYAAGVASRTSASPRREPTLAWGRNVLLTLLAPAADGGDG